MLHQRLHAGLYTEAMLLADEARSYFDRPFADEQARFDAGTRVGFSCESLKLTTRLMNVIAWLLTQRAVAAGEIAPRDALAQNRRLGDAAASDPQVVAAMPEHAQALIRASIDLHRRVAHLDTAHVATPSVPSPVLHLHQRLAAAF